MPRRIARSRDGVTGSRVTAPGMPMAWSMAAAIAAPAPLVPSSPAPLMPSGVSGEGDVNGEGGGPDGA